MYNILKLGFKGLYEEDNDFKNKEYIIDKNSYYEY
jgi:hypothetical protein